MQVGEFKMVNNENAFEYRPYSAWLNTTSYSRVYFIHPYFMIGLQYLGESTKTKESTCASWISNVIILLNSVQYGLSDSPNLINYPEIQTSYNVWYRSVRFSSMYLQVPFKFYIIKECLFTIYDEFRYKAISSKINDLKRFSSDNKPYSNLMVEKIREDLYEIVRLPFLKFSKKEYITISSIIYAMTIPPIVILHLWQNDEITYLRIHWETLNLNCALVEPIIVFIVSGYYYIKVANEYDIKGWRVKLAYGF